MPKVSRREPPTEAAAAATPFDAITLALGAGSVILASLLAAMAWWSGRTPAAPWLGTAAAVALCLSLGALIARLALRAWADARALAAFSAHLREGDVAGALRAVRAEPQASTFVAGTASGPMPPDDGEPSTQPHSQFDRAAREVEQALGERERRWQARMRLSADWHWETDSEFRFTWVSQDLASLVKLGVRPADLIGRRPDEVPLFRPPEQGWAAVLARVGSRKALRDLTIEVQRRSRSPVWLLLNGRAYHDEAGRFVGYEGVGRDITEQRLAHLRLAESERRHAMMAELAADWFWRSDASHRVQELGPVALAMYGDRADLAIGRTRWEASPDGASEAEWAAHRADLDAQRDFRNFEFAVRQAGHGLRWVSVSGVPRHDAKGAFLGYHGVGRDITLKKRAERLLLTRNEQLERLVAERTAELEHSNRDLEAFSRQLAHELRTPIGQVVGLTDLIKARAWERLAGDEREWLRLAGQAAREMSHTVTALLELARSTSTALLIEPVDLSALAESVIADLPWLERKAPVEWRIEPGLAAHCSAALARVVLTNLLGNAAKFTRDVAAPWVAFGRDAEAGDMSEGGFAVEDNGAGFDAERAAQLFQPFVRLHRGDQFQGTGLGLSIVRRIVERHGGSVSARGESGHGARFAFRFSPPRAAMQGLSSTDVAAA